MGLNLLYYSAYWIYHYILPRLRAVSLLLENLCASTKPGYTASIELCGSEYEPALAHRFEQKRDCTVYILHIIIQTP